MSYSDPLEFMRVPPQVDRPPLRVLITVDTEFWPHTTGWQQRGLADDYERDILGRTKTGEFGLRFQLDMLEAHRLKAVFFIEALSVRVTGPSYLAKTVSLVRQHQQDAQLHVHTEWLQWMQDSPLLGRRTGQDMHCFTAAEQGMLLAEAANNLRHAGGDELCAFRAGNYGANNDTLRCLSKAGISIDSSYNFPDSKRGHCRIEAPGQPHQPIRMDGVVEYPISFFEDWPGHYRFVQLCSCSTREMRTALLRAWQAGWRYFVIVSHSFELLKNRKAVDAVAVEDTVIIHRMEALCSFLSNNRDRFQTTTFQAIREEQPSSPFSTPIAGTLWHTAERYFEQAALRLR
jgi:hypothetical protein